MKAGNWHTLHAEPGGVDLLLYGGQDGQTYFGGAIACDPENPGHCMGAEGIARSVWNDGVIRQMPFDGYTPPGILYSEEATMQNFESFAKSDEPTSQ